MQHQAPLDIVRRNPAIVAVLLSQYLGVKLPKFDGVRMGPTDVSRVTTTSDGKGTVKERRSDNVVVFTRKIDGDTDPRWLAETRAQWEAEWPGKFEDAIADGSLPVLAVVVESQRSKENEKRSAWPEYVDGTRSQCRCPTMLLVICDKAGVARWCARPIYSGHPGHVLKPLVIGPKQIPVITDESQAQQHPELTVLAALIHAKDKDADKFLRAFLAAIRQFPERERLQYTEALGRGLRKQARQRFKQLLEENSTMRMQYKSELSRMLFGPALDEGERIGREKGRVEGRIESEAKILRMILREREISLRKPIREKINACTDKALLEQWIRRAITATSADQIFT